MIYSLLIVAFVFIVVVVVLVLVIILCFCVSYKCLKNLSSPKSAFFTKLCLGHRGAKAENYPFSENTMTSFAYSFEHGADGIEIDVNFTKDYKLAIFHDIQTVKRVMLTSSNEPKIRSMRLKDARKGCSFKKGKSDTIPTLEEVVREVRNYNKKRKFKIMIELKEWKVFESVIMAFKVSQLFQKYPFLYGRSVIGSFNPFVLFIIRKIDPKIVVNMLFWRDLFTHYVRKGYDWPDTQLFDGVRTGKYQYFKFLCPILNWIYNVSMLSWVPSFIGAGVIGFSRVEARENNWDIVRKMKDRGYEVNIWGINDKEEKKELIRNGVSVTTDFTFD